MLLVTGLHALFEGDCALVDLGARWFTAFSDDCGQGSIMCCSLPKGLDKCLPAAKGSANGAPKGASATWAAASFQVPACQGPDIRGHLSAMIHELMFLAVQRTVSPTSLILVYLRSWVLECYGATVACFAD